MTKKRNKIYDVNPWKIVESDFHVNESMVSESIFSLANEYMGVRGYFEEQYTGSKLVGSYINGVYERESVEPSLYKGISDRSDFMLNSVDWLYLRISIDDNTLDLANCTITDYVRELDLREGVLRRKFIWKLSAAQNIEVSFERFLSMVTPEYAYQKVRLKPLDFTSKVKIVSGLDFSIKHQSKPGQHWINFDKNISDDCISIAAHTNYSKKAVLASFKLDINQNIERSYIEEDKFIGQQFELDLVQGKEVQFVKKVGIFWDSINSKEQYKYFCKKSLKKCNSGLDSSWKSALKEHISYWDDIWKKNDISIKGDPENQQGIRFCIFQLHQTYQGRDPSLNIGAKGLTGETYDGLAFWDTEIYCLPFYLFTNPKSARSLLLFRYYGLDKARERARELDCKGAFYPVATLNGNENSTLWQHSNLQLQATTAVAYAIRHYHKVVGDLEFLYEQGLEMLIEISRFLQSRCQVGQRSGKMGFYGVMGPDEFQLMVNHNAYTNFMAKETLLFTLEVLKKLKEHQRSLYEEKKEKYEISEIELNTWTNTANNIYIPYEQATGIYEQHEGFFDLPHFSVRNIPNDQFPLYDHWSYDRIYRNDIIKQPDVLMFMFLYSQMFRKEEKLANYEYYSPKTAHESSLSPSIHSILAVELGKHEEALELFRFATRLDLDNYNRNTDEGLHITSIGAAWMNIIYGFAGMRSDSQRLSFRPTIPHKWNEYSFQIEYGNSQIKVTIDRYTASFILLKGSSLELIINDEEHLLNEEKLTVELAD